MKRILTWLAGGFVAAEIVVRIAEAMLLSHPVGVLYDMVVVKGDHWTLRPNAAVSNIERSGNVSYVLNAEGYRGPQIRQPKSGQRVVFLGDSVTFGLGAVEADTYVRQLERRLSSPATPVEAISLALFSYSPPEYLSTWRRLGSKLQPDAVVLQLYMNDLGAKPFNAPQTVSTWNLINHLGLRVVQLSAVLRRLHQGMHMAFYHWIRPWRRASTQDAVNDAEPRGVLALLRATKDFEKLDSVPETRTLLAEIKAAGVPVILMFSPHEAQLYKTEFDEIDRTVAGAFAESADAYVSPLEALRASPRKTTLFHDGLHYARDGHAVVADVLEAPLRRILASRAERR